MKYVALLRGINVGGNNKVSMAELKVLFGENGYTNVVTYINSGNVIFESDKKLDKIVEHLEKLLSEAFNYKARVMVFSHDQIKSIVEDAPKDWHTRTDIRCYAGFLSDFATKDMIDGIQVREGVDWLKVGRKVVYMTTLMDQRTKSAYNKLVGTKVYFEMTVRNFTTVKKVLSLMETN